MTTSMDQKERKEWIKRIGGEANATRAIQEKLDCSFSKAEKIAAGRYPSSISPTEQRAIADLWERPRERIFKLVTASRKRRAS